MTRKEILFRENITLWNEYNTLTGAATTDLDEYAHTYKYQKALKESRAFDLGSANESLRQKIEKAKAEKERAAKVEAFYQTPEEVHRDQAALGARCSGARCHRGVQRDGRGDEARAAGLHPPHPR